MQADNLIYLTDYQKKILFELLNAGKIITFKSPIKYEFYDADGYVFPFRKDTFDILTRNRLIKFVRRYPTTRTIYGISKKGKEVLGYNTNIRF